MSVMSKVVPTVGIIVILTIFSSYTFGILSANQENINVTGTPYEQQYETSSKVQGITAELFSPISLVLGILLIAGLLMSVRKRRRW